MALGVPGPAGEQGEPGANGQNGVGVAAGGLINQVLVKLSNDDFDTGWANGGAGGDYLPLSGGTMSGTIFLPSLRNLLNTDLTVTAYNDTGAGTNFVHTFDAFDGTFALATNGGGLKFPDETVQVTAGLPLTGGIMTGDGAFINLGSVGAGNTVIELAPDEARAEFTNLQVRLAGSAQLKFPDESIQTTAFPPSGGTTSQYIRGDGSLNTFPAVGDRYLTSSTSTLTCDSGNGKTMTVGTGLSYSRQQDITVSYSNSIHMHGTVLTYDSATGVMTFDANTHSGSGTYSNWEVNVGGVAGAILPVAGTAGQVLAKINSTNFNTEWVSLGSASTLASSALLQTANNLSDLSSSSTARTNLGLGSMATQSTSAFLSTASAVANYLSISNASATYLTQSSASSTYIAQASFATTAEAQAGTSTTTVISPSTLLDAKYFQGGKSMVQITWSTSVSGTGASASAQNANARLNAAPTTATGYAIASAFIANNSRGSTRDSGFDFSKRVQFGVRVARNVASPDSASVFRFSIGKNSATDASDLSARGLMIKVAGSGALQLLVHNGTALSTATSSFTPANGQAYDVIVTSDGAGNCALFVNGSSVATSTGGPTTAGSTNAAFIMFEVQNTSVITGSPQNICVSDYHVQVNS
jgi:hypothetical protein